MTHEIIEKNDDLDDIILIGIMKKGLPIAQIIQENIKLYSGKRVEIVGIDISMYRDDNKKKSVEIPAIQVNNKICILVDDVLYTGRTVRAAMDALISLGRPRKIQLAVLVDRGHREFPIRADYVGKNIPTGQNETVLVQLTKDNPGVYLEKEGE
jgi:pyrimidine operon attenuation protein/uracil phosphoribosyltransferase